MMMIKLISVLALGLAMTSCRTNNHVEGRSSLNDTSSNSQSKKIAGYSFAGVTVRDALPQGHFCAHIVSPESDACHDVGGTTLLDKNCNALCTLPIAKPGKLAGFDFTGLQIRNALAPNSFCSLIATPENDACIDVGGISKYDNSCKILCSEPIAQTGFVAGFNFQGLQKKKALTGFCVLVATPESDACSKVGGKSVFDDDCNTLCSQPIAK